MLREEFHRWEELLSSLSEEQINAPDLPGDWSIKDVIAHLRGWQERSVAYCEAALLDREPVFPEWPTGPDPESKENLDRTNEWIYENHRGLPWPDVHRAWKDGILQLLELGEKIPEKDLLDPGRYPWLEGDPLSVVFLGSYEHHHEEHLEPLVAWLRGHGQGKAVE